MALRVGYDVALAALGLLSGVVAARAAALRGLHRLAVDHARRRAGLASGLLARRHDQRMVDRGEPSRDHA